MRKLWRMIAILGLVLVQLQACFTMFTAGRVHAQTGQVILSTPVVQVTAEGTRHDDYVAWQIDYDLTPSTDTSTRSLRLLISNDEAGQIPATDVHGDLQDDAQTQPWWRMATPTATAATGQVIVRTASDVQQVYVRVQVDRHLLGESTEMLAGEDAQPKKVTLAAATTEDFAGSETAESEDAQPANPDEQTGNQTSQQPTDGSTSAGNQSANLKPELPATAQPEEKPDTQEDVTTTEASGPDRQDEKIPDTDATDAEAAVEPPSIITRPEPEILPDSELTPDVEPQPNDTALASGPVSGIQALVLWSNDGPNIKEGDEFFTRRDTILRVFRVASATQPVTWQDALPGEYICPVDTMVTIDHLEVYRDPDTKAKWHYVVKMFDQETYQPGNPSDVVVSDRIAGYRPATLWNKESIELDAAVPYRAYTFYNDAPRQYLNFWKRSDALANWEHLNGAVFSVSRNGKVAHDLKQTIPTSGMFEIQLLEGEYLFTETVAPEGYEPGAQFRVSVTLDDEYNTQITADGLVKVNGNNAFYNRKNPYHFRLIKSASTGERLAGASFQISGDSVFAQGKTNRQGELELDPKPDLPPGNYEIEELAAPEGFAELAGTFTLTIGANHQTVALTYSGSDLEKKDYRVEMVPSATGNATDYVVYIVNHAAGPPVAQGSLPHTGGPGHWWLISAGLLLMFGATLIHRQQRRWD